MSTFSGVMMLPVLAGQLAGISPQISALSAPAPDVGLVTGGMAGAKSGTGLTSSSVPGGAAGVLETSHATEQAGKVIVIPRTRALGFVFSDQNIAVELWNTSDRARQLTGVSVTGPDGVSVSNSYSLPKSMPVGASYTYTVTVSASGSPVINNTVTWTYTGLTAADITLTGSRLVPFALSPDWDAGIVEHAIYYTDVMTAYDGTEQRVQLLAKAQRGFDYTMMTEGQLDVALMTALLYGWQSKIYGVPVWTELQRTTAQTTAGSSTISVDTTNMDLSAGFVMLWTDMRTWEAFQVTGYTSSSISVASPAAATWPVNSILLPVVNARLDLEQDVDYITPELATLSVRFTTEIVS